MLEASGGQKPTSPRYTCPCQFPSTYLDKSRRTHSQPNIALTKTTSPKTASAVQSCQHPRRKNQQQGEQNNKRAARHRTKPKYEIE